MSWLVIGGESEEDVKRNFEEFMFMLVAITLCTGVIALIATLTFAMVFAVLSI